MSVFTLRNEKQKSERVRNEVVPMIESYNKFTFFENTFCGIQNRGYSKKHVQTMPYRYRSCPNELMD